MKIAVIGAGNGGQAIAAYLSILGCEVNLYDRNKQKILELRAKGGITLQGKLSGFGKIDNFTTNVGEAVKDADIVMVTTIANVHQQIAKQIALDMHDGQIVILNPGRTCGALVFKQALIDSGCIKRVYISEAQTLVYACRIVENGTVNVIGVKDEVLLSALPSADTDYVLNKITPMYPCFKKAENVLRTSLENIGAMFHPCVCLFNAASIERQEQFWFYRDMTDQVANYKKNLMQSVLPLEKPMVLTC